MNGSRSRHSFRMIPKGFRERNAVGILQVMDDFAKSVGKEERGAGEVEGVLARSAQAAQAFNGRRRIAALRAEGQRNGNETRPAVRARGSVPALENRTHRRRRSLGKEGSGLNRSNRVGETQRANHIVPSKRDCDRFPRISPSDSCTSNTARVVDDGERRGRAVRGEVPASGRE